MLRVLVACGVKDCRWETFSRLCPFVWLELSLSGNIGSVWGREWEVRLKTHDKHV